MHRLVTCVSLYPIKTLDNAACFNKWKVWIIVKVKLFLFIIEGIFGN